MTTPDLGFIHLFQPAPHLTAEQTPAAATTVVLLHGTGANEYDLLELGHTIAPDANILSPRGKVLEQGMPRYFRRFPNGVFDQEDLAFRARELADFLGRAAAHYRFDPKQVVALGFSNGANIAAAMFLLQPTAFAGGLLFSPANPLDNPPTVDLTSKQIFIGSGRADQICPPVQAEQLGAKLQTLGAEVSIFWHDSGHTIVPSELRAAQGWYHGRWQ